MTSRPVIAVDLGGTKIRAGVVTGGRVTNVHSAPTPARLGASSVLDAVADLVARALTAVAPHDQAPLLLAVGSAGVIDPDSGLVISATDALPGWAGTNLITELQHRTRLSVRVVNDVHAHTLGEASYGASATARDSLLVAVGTGIGAGVICNGRLVTGRHAAAGHLGHMPSSLAAGLPCPCGGAGHLEAIASGPAVLNEYRRAGGRATSSSAAELAEQAREGDATAREAFATAGRALGSALGGVANILSPEVIVLSGGLVQAGDLWWPHLEQAFAEELIPAVRGLSAQRAQLGADAALIGAASLWDGATTEIEESQ
ncbi:ROK family protein [Kocuria sp. cx-455]|uniref:ROK family protein n=1 Tax=Kocuria sp. cx-455 TaxID=2771377 RepID=UPI0028059704|nr:ROK family protein [Kocuria sp. cx-455]